jgi:hypothetical protein
MTTSVSEEDAVSIIKVEHGGGMFLQNCGTCVQTTWYHSPEENNCIHLINF